LFSCQDIVRLAARTRWPVWLAELIANNNLAQIRKLDSVIAWGGSCEPPKSPLVTGLIH